MDSKNLQKVEKGLKIKAATKCIFKSLKISLNSCLVDISSATENAY